MLKKINYISSLEGIFTFHRNSLTPLELNLTEMI